jgi:hypothetical protein
LVLIRSFLLGRDILIKEIRAIGLKLAGDNTSFLGGCHIEVARRPQHDVSPFKKRRKMVAGRQTERNRANERRVQDEQAVSLYHVAELRSTCRSSQVSNIRVVTTSDEKAYEEGPASGPGKEGGRQPWGMQGLCLCKEASPSFNAISPTGRFRFPLISSMHPPRIGPFGKIDRP